MNSRTHFRNQTGSIFTRVECQIACALDRYVRTRRHRRDPVDHSQPPTLQMLNAIMEEARWIIWDAAHSSRTSCNPMRPDAFLNAYCLVRNLRNSPSHRRWYDEVLNNPGFWSGYAVSMFDAWVATSSRLVQDLRYNGTLAQYY